ncbi:hypothetical protein V8C86DRAFT_3030732 [Haematococcus lacustris]
MILILWVCCWEVPCLLCGVPGLLSALMQAMPGAAGWVTSLQGVGPWWWGPAVDLEWGGQWEGPSCWQLLPQLLVVVLVQEMQRYNRLLGVIRTSLMDGEPAVGGAQQQLLTYPKADRWPLPLPLALGLLLTQPSPWPWRGVPDHHPVLTSCHWLRPGAGLMLALGRLGVPRLFTPAAAGALACGTTMPSQPAGQAQGLAGGQQGSGSKPSSQVGTRAAVLAWPDHAWPYIAHAHLGQCALQLAAAAGAAVHSLTQACLPGAGDWCCVECGCGCQVTRWAQEAAAAWTLDRVAVSYLFAGSAATGFTVPDLHPPQIPQQQRLLAAAGAVYACSAAGAIKQAATCSQRKAAANKLVMSPDGGRQALPDDVARRAIQLGAGGALSLTCRAFSKTNLLHAPALRIQLDSQRCDQFLSARVVAALNARTCKQALTLEEQQAQNSRQYIRLLTRVLRRLPSCAAVEACRLRSSKGPFLCRKLLPCRSDLALELVSSAGNSGLASLLSHPQLSLQLQQLDLSSTTIQPKRPEPGATTLATLFHASRLKQLSLLINNTAGGGNNLLLHNLQPLSQHLTKLCLVHQGYVECLNKFIAALQPLAQLQVLTISGLWYLGGLPGLLQALPQLHTLQLPDAVVKGQEQLDTLLAATQLTSIQLHSLERLTNSCADVPCSWQRLELTDSVDCATAAHLPLHSLTQPLVLGALSIRIDEGDNCALAAAAVHNLTQACKVPLKIEDLWLYMSEAAMAAELQVELQPLVAVLQALKHCSWGRVYVAHMNVGAADVLTLAPLCQACTELEFAYGSLTPSLDFWRQLLQLLPTVTHLTFSDSKGSNSAAMCKSLERMAEQPWARWLDICISRPSHSDGLPACWRASPLTQPDKLSVWFNTMIQ